MRSAVWKFYFWMILALDMVSFVMPLDRRAWEFIETGLFLVALCGLFGYCWERRIVARLFWQVFLVVFLGWLLVYFFIIPSPVRQASTAGLAEPTIIALVAVTALLHVPLVWALFAYGFRRGDIWERDTGLSQ